MIMLPVLPMPNLNPQLETDNIGTGNTSTLATLPPPPSSVYSKTYAEVSDPFTQFQSGCCPSCAFHAHSVIFMSVKTAVNEESSGEQA